MNLQNQKFGKLTVKQLIVEKPYDKRKWLCECECGNICTRLETSLKASKRDGRISSCGCIPKQNLIPGNSERCSKAGLHRKDAFINGSNVQIIFREGLFSTNTSGCQGVSWSKKAKKWHVYVGYQNYRTNLGFYEDKNFAIKIRKLAEDAIKNNTFEDFFYSIRGFHLGERNKKLYKN